jgi:hypothetical protein
MLVPSCTIKARFLKSLPVGTVFQDPNNRFNYEIIEKKINKTLTKVAKPHFEGKIPIEIDVPAHLVRCRIQ